MNPGFFILAFFTLAAAVLALSLRNLVHCALALAAAFVGLAAVYLRLDAQFIGFAQILVYVGAVAILIVFAILLTGGSEAPRQPIISRSWWVGLGVAAAVFATLTAVILSSAVSKPRPLSPAPVATVRRIGEELMTRYVLPLEVVGLLLTAALIGAVIIALREKEGA